MLLGLAQGRIRGAKAVYLLSRPASGAGSWALTGASPWATLGCSKGPRLGE